MPRSKYSSNTLSAPRDTLPAACPPNGHRTRNLASMAALSRRLAGQLEPIPWVYAEIIRNLARRERVELIVNDAAAGRQVGKLL